MHLDSPRGTLLQITGQVTEASTPPVWSENSTALAPAGRRGGRLEPARLE